MVMTLETLSMSGSEGKVEGRYGERKCEIKDVKDFQQKVLIEVWLERLTKVKKI